MALDPEQLLADPRPVVTAFLTVMSVLASAAAVAEASSRDGNPVGAHLLHAAAQVTRCALGQIAIDDDLRSEIAVGVADFGLAVSWSSCGKTVAASTWNRARSRS